MTATELLQRNEEYWANAGPEPNAALDRNMEMFLGPLLIAAAKTLGWTKEGSLWVQPDKSKARAWTDAQLIEHLKATIK